MRNTFSKKQFYIKIACTVLVGLPSLEVRANSSDIKLEGKKYFKFQGRKKSDEYISVECKKTDVIDSYICAIQKNTAVFPISDFYDIIANEYDIRSDRQKMESLRFGLLKLVDTEFNFKKSLELVQKYDAKSYFKLNNFFTKVNISDNEVNDFFKTLNDIKYEYASMHSAVKKVHFTKSKDILIAKRAPHPCKQYEIHFNDVKFEYVHNVDVDRYCAKFPNIKFQKISKDEFSKPNIKHKFDSLLDDLPDF